MEMGNRQRQEGTVGCKDLVKKAALQLESAGFCPTNRELTLNVWKQLAAFGGHRPFSEDIAHHFLLSCGLPKNWAILSAMCVPFRHRRTVIAIRMLVRYSAVECICAAPPKVADDLPLQFVRIVRDYEHYCARCRRYRAETLCCQIRKVQEFLRFTAKRIGPTLKDVDAGHVSEFLNTKSGCAPRSVVHLIAVLRLFFRYLWTTEILLKDLSLYLPRVRTPQEPHVPNVWSKEQIEAILASIDRNAPQGKRDYAMLLLGCRLGLRAKDIRNLRLENVNWPAARIDIVQSKTGVALSLPMSHEVGDAIVDYLRHGRPKTAFREVFMALGQNLWVVG